MLNELPEGKLVEGAVVLEVPGSMSRESMERLRTDAERVWPGKEVIVLTDGIQISHAAQLDRIESKLEALLEQTKPKRAIGAPP